MDVVDQPTRSGDQPDESANVRPLVVRRSSAAPPPRRPTEPPKRPPVAPPVQGKRRGIPKTIWIPVASVLVVGGAVAGLAGYAAGHHTSSGAVPQRVDEVAPATSSPNSDAASVPDPKTAKTVTHGPWIVVPADAPTGKTGLTVVLCDVTDAHKSYFFYADAGQQVTCTNGATPRLTR